MSKIKPKSGAFLSAFCTELAMIIETGIPISDGLLMLIDDETDERAAAYLSKIRDQMEKGHRFSTAAEKVGGFPQYALDMLVIGEKTGRLDAVLRSLSLYYDRDVKIKESIKNAIVFPIVLFVLLLAVMWILLTQVLPVFEEVFGRLGVSVGTVAGTLMNVGDFLERFSVVILTVVAAIIALVFITYRINALKKTAKGLFSHLFGNSRFMQCLLTARFSASMAMTLKSGLDLDESLILALSFAPNKQAADKIEECRRSISEGETFNDAVLKTRILSPLYCRMLALSFKTGSTDDIMEVIAEKSEEDVAVSIDTLIGRIEPAMAFIMSVLIGLVLLSVMFPLLAVMGA
ncbi:MAG: type II secretion system F family protein [Oscillospiraceae bacterium]|nr:type II secretion system F family protein [Oscillospiraceae bacterium]